MLTDIIKNVTLEIVVIQLLYRRKIRMQTTEQVAKRPFHETIVEAIRHASISDLQCLAVLIKATKIPAGHDEIIAAWNKAAWPGHTLHDDYGVPADLLEQKQEATEKAKAKEKEQTIAVSP